MSLAYSIISYYILRYLHFIILDIEKDNANYISARCNLHKFEE